MAIHEKIMADWKIALKNRDIKKDALNQILSEFKNRAIEEKVALEEGRILKDDLAIEALLKMAKQRKESIEVYKAAKRQDLVDKEIRELLVIETYLPKALNPDELLELVKNAIEEVNASSLKDIGKVMPVAIKKAAGRASGKEIQNIAQRLLGDRSGNN